MAPKRRAYELTRRAEADLESIFAYTAEQWSLEQAERYVRQLYVAFAGLASGVHIGRDAELQAGVMKLPVGRHVVYYIATDSGVTVVRILHGPWTPPATFKPKRRATSSHGARRRGSLRP